MPIKYPEGCFVGINKDIRLVKRIRPTKDRKGFLCEFECPYCHKIFKANLYNVNRSYYSCGCWRKKHTFFQKEDLTNQKFGKLTVLKDTGKRVIGNKKTQEKCNVIWLCICDCGEKTEVSSAHLKSGHTTSCGKCCISKGEDKIKNSLQLANIKFEQQKRFTDCKDKSVLPFDFYLPDFNCCIEYDGEQHFHIPKNKKSTFFTPEKIKDIQRKDNIKTKYCQTHKIGLIRIPYTDFNKIDINYLNNQIDKVQNKDLKSGDV